jgi:hypothetical protein
MPSYQFKKAPGAVHSQAVGEWLEYRNLRVDTIDKGTRELLGLGIGEPNGIQPEVVSPKAKYIRPHSSPATMNITVLITSMDFR